MSKLIDLTGKKFGRLTVIKRAENRGKQVRWLCKCDCGGETITSSQNLREGHTKSCGCYNKDINRELHLKHGDGGRKEKTRLYRIWAAMLRRCETPTTERYQKYGAKGISVCKEWHDYINFKEWAISNGYADTLTIDRIDSKGNYEPSNCRWATAKEQANNIFTNRKITFNGVTKNLQQWADEYQIYRKTLSYRLDNGWDIEKALTTKARGVA